MDATMPEELAISKNVSGVVSPKPNLPSEVEAKMNLSVEPSWNNTSLLNTQSPVIVSSADLEAGPLAQSKLIEDQVPFQFTLKSEASKDMDDTLIPLSGSDAPISMVPPPPPPV